MCLGWFVLQYEQVPVTLWNRTSECFLKKLNCQLRDYEKTMACVLPTCAPYLQYLHPICLYLKR